MTREQTYTFSNFCCSVAEEVLKLQKKFNCSAFMAVDGNEYYNKRQYFFVTLHFN